MEHLVGMFRLNREGGLAETTGDVRALTGHDPRGFADFARDHAEMFAPRSVAVAER